ncbi:MAG: hypothetical protein Q4D13_08825 [Erysipelotrichaceae bacterium]|nr:hypothetical protein [Erysipelotrichaceae bacterium]
MKNELIKDNWLEEEKARESRISIWEMYDNRRDVFNEHQENCDRNNVYQEHVTMHNRYRNLSSGNSDQYYNSEFSRKVMGIVAVSVLIVVLFILLVVFFSM